MFAIQTVHVDLMASTSKILIICNDYYITIFSTRYVLFTTGQIYILHHVGGPVCNCINIIISLSQTTKYICCKKNMNNSFKITNIPGRELNRATPMGN